jgi:hypothetical protein
MTDSPVHQHLKEDRLARGLTPFDRQDTVIIAGSLLGFGSWKRDQPSAEIA